MNVSGSNDINYSCDIGIPLYIRFDASINTYIETSFKHLVFTTDISKVNGNPGFNGLCS